MYVVLCIPVSVFLFRAFLGPCPAKSLCACGVLLGYTKQWWQGLAIVLSSVCGAPSFGGLGGCFLWGRDKSVCVKTVVG